MVPLKLCWVGATKSATQGKVLKTILKIGQKSWTKTSFQLNLLIRSQNIIWIWNLKKKPFQNKTGVTTDTRFFKLPYIIKYSNIAQKMIQNYVKIFCKDIDVKAVLTLFKISNKFSDKYPLPFNF